MNKLGDYAETIYNTFANDVQPDAQLKDVFIQQDQEDEATRIHVRVNVMWQDPKKQEEGPFPLDKSLGRRVETSVSRLIQELGGHRVISVTISQADTSEYILEVTRIEELRVQPSKREDSLVLVSDVVVRDSK